MPQISIIIPVYNKIKYLATMLGDVQNQTFQDFECILIDDGSSDGSDAVCDQFASEDGHFHVVHIQNSGVSRARNVGLDMARGEYLTFLDSDDRIHSEFLQNLYDCLTQSGADMVIGGVEKVWPEKNLAKVVPMPFEGIQKMRTLLPTFARVQRDTGVYGICTAKIFRRKTVADIRFDENIHLAEDFDFYLRLYDRTRTICFDSKPYYTYLQGAENSSALVDSSRIDYLSQLKVNLHYRRFLQGRGAYSGENQEIVDTLLRNYCYFVLFHTPMDSYVDKFNAVNQFVASEHISVFGSGLLQKWLLFLLKKNYSIAAKNTMQCYRALRKMMGRK